MTTVRGNSDPAPFGGDENSGPVGAGADPPARGRPIPSCDPTNTAATIAAIPASPTVEVRRDANELVGRRVSGSLITIAAGPVGGGASKRDRDAPPGRAAPPAPVGPRLGP